MKVNKTKIFMSLVVAFSLILVMFFNSVPSIIAQSDQGWSDPINLSKSGASKDPLMFVDLDGMIHVIWVDDIDGFKYTQSADGKEWSSPKSVDFPFNSKVYSEPIFVVVPDGTIKIFWRDENDTLYYSETSSLNFSIPGTWAKFREIADAALNFDVATDETGALHLVYISSKSDDVSTAGVYYQRQDVSGWSSPEKLFTSLYFRSLLPSDTHIRVAASTLNGVSTVYTVWDDRPQKRIYLAKSSDGGLNWEDATQLRGPDDVAGIEFPFNIDLVVDKNTVLLFWQLGLPGGRCSQFSQWSLDGGDSFEDVERMIDEFSACPQYSEPVFHNDDFSLIYLYFQNDFSLIAWNGTKWSSQQSQVSSSTFVNPITLDNVILGCQRIIHNNSYLYLVGCDQGRSGDIWFSYRQLGDLVDWFPPSTSWTSPVEITSVENNLSDISFVADENDKIYAFWGRSSLPNGDASSSKIQHSQWNGVDWSNPVDIASVSEKTLQFSVNVDSNGRLLLTWIDEKTGELSFQWASIEQAGRTSEWVDQLFVPTGFQSISSPDIFADDSGRILIGYAKPINESRGIYFVSSIDAGRTWSQPLQIYDAQLAGWDWVDQPKICLTGDGRLHSMFGRYSYQGDQRQSLGHYYAQSANGGETWSEPDAVSEGVVLWSEIYCDGKQTLHRLWQEEKQATRVTYHQNSQDSGLTWSKPLSVSSIDSHSLLTSSVLDRVGNLHLIQMTSENEVILIEHKVWNGSRWITQETNEILRVDDPGVPTAITTAITSDGKLLVSAIVESPFAANDGKNEIFSVGKFLSLQENVQTPYPAIIPTIEEESNQIIEETQDLALIPTQPVSLADLNDSPSSLTRNRNIAGILLVGGIVILMFFVTRSRSK